MTKSRRRAALPAVMMTFVLLLMACGGEPADVSPSVDQSTLPDGFYSASEFRQAVRATFPEYRWPPGYTTTADAILERFSGGRSMEGEGFQVGLEHTVIDTWHGCAWYMTWLDAFRNGDSAQQADALQVMTDILPNSSTLDPSAKEFLLEIAEKAALGDPSLVVQQVEGNCAGIPIGQNAEQGDGTAEVGATHTYTTVTAISLVHIVQDNDLLEPAVARRSVVR